MKNYQVQCPYCGSMAVLKPAAKLFGPKTRERNRFLYVCPNWPACDSYVMAHIDDLRPMGTMADGKLRHKRILAHKALSAYRKATHTEKWAAYIWLEGKLGLDQQHTHIGMFSSEECDKVISLCKQAAGVTQRSQRRGAAQ